MKPLPHVYEVHLAGGPTGYATVRVEGAPELSSAPPREFGGPGDAWGPEHFLLAAVESCFLFTLRAVAQASRVQFEKLDISSRGTVDKQDGVLRFTEIVLRPKLTLAAGTERDRALRALEKSERGCLVSASLSTPIRLEPEIVSG